MQTTYTSGILQSSLPADTYGTATKNGSDFIKDMVKEQMLHTKDVKLEKELNSQFLLHKYKLLGKRKRHRRNQYLTRKEKFELNILKLNKDGWNYNDLQPMRGLWQEYMHDNLERVERAPDCSKMDWSSFSVLLGKAEYVGAEIEVIRSTVPNLVGKRGTVVLETKQTFQIVTRDNQLKVLLKAPSVFQIKLDDLKFTFFGKHLQTRPSERSVKKIKTFMHPDL